MNGHMAMTLRNSPNAALIESLNSCSGGLGMLVCKVLHMTCTYFLSRMPSIRQHLQQDVRQAGSAMIAQRDKMCQRRYGCSCYRCETVGTCRTGKRWNILRCKSAQEAFALESRTPQTLLLAGAWSNNRPSAQDSEDDVRGKGDNNVGRLPI